MSRRGEKPGAHIIPDGFVDRFDSADSVSEALEIMESRPSSTDIAEQDRCPACDSRALYPKPGRGDDEQRKPGRFLCDRCGAHVETPAPGHAGPPAEFDWVRKPADADERTALDAPLAGLDDETLTVVALMLREPWRDDSSRSYREIAALIPYSRTWVGERVRAWRDGEYRELVADPTLNDTPTVDPFEYGGAVAATDGGRRRRRWDAYGSD